MKLTQIYVLGTLVVVFAAAIGLGLLVHRVHIRRPGRADAQEHLGLDGMAGAVGFIGGSAAFLLGVLMLASLDHYNGTKAVVGEEALAYSAAFEASAGLPEADKPQIQHDLVCLMRSITINSWAAAAEGRLSGSENTHAWRRRAFSHADAVQPTTKIQEESLSSLQAELINASKSGQQRLLAAESDLPGALWILVFVSIFVLTAILTALLRAHPSRTLSIAALSAVFVLSVAMLSTLTTFDEPFSKGDGVYISPRALNAVMVRLEGTYPEADWGPCEMLADS